MCIRGRVVGRRGRGVGRPRPRCRVAGACHRRRVGRRGGDERRKEHDHQRRDEAKVAPGPYDPGCCVVCSGLRAVHRCPAPLLMWFCSTPTSYGGCLLHFRTSIPGRLPVVKRSPCRKHATGRKSLHNQRVLKGGAHEGWCLVSWRKNRVCAVANTRPDAAPIG